MTRKNQTKHILMDLASLALAVPMLKPCMAAEKLNDLPSISKESASVSKVSDPVELKAMTVEEEAILDSDDPYNKSYTVTKSGHCSRCAVDGAWLSTDRVLEHRTDGGKTSS